jgi:hypothetical protein
MKIFTSIFLLFFSYNLAFPQNCGTTTCTSYKNLNDRKYKENLEKFDAIFEGEIISQSEPIQPEKEFPYRLLKVKVLRVWKGIDKSEADVEFGYYDNDCLQLGESGKLLFYASATENKSVFRTGWCNKYSFDDEQTKRILGEGKVFEEPEPQQFNQPTEPQESLWSRIWQKIVSFFN